MASGTTSSQLKAPHSPSSHANTTHWSALGSAQALASACSAAYLEFAVGEGVAHANDSSEARDNDNKGQGERSILIRS